MKKILLSTFILLAMNISLLQAQEEKTNTVSLSYGVASTDDFVDLFGNIFTSIVGLTTNSGVSSGAISLNYSRNVNKMLQLGGTFAYQQSTADAYIFGSYVGKDNRYYLTIALEGRIVYLTKPIFKLYSGAGVGYTIAKGEIQRSDKQPNTTEDFSHFNFQVTGVGFRVGKDLAGIAEVGFGYKGIVNAGVSYRF